MVTVLHPQVTDHATTALLHYQLPQMPDVVVRSFMVSGFRAQAFQLGRDLTSQAQVIPETLSELNKPPEVSSTDK